MNTFFCYQLRVSFRININDNVGFFQYGRVNIESANKKRGIIDHVEEEEVVGHAVTNQKLDTPPTPKINGLTKKLSQNGIDSLISKESLTLVPEGGDTITQNGHANEKQEPNEAKFANNNNENSDQVIKICTVNKCETQSYQLR